MLTASFPTRLVIDTLGPLPQDRKCFRMINGVLVERTVKDVIPSLKTNSDGLKQVLDDLLKQYKTKQDEMESWKVRDVRAAGHRANVQLQLRWLANASTLS